MTGWEKHPHYGMPPEPGELKRFLISACLVVAGGVLAVFLVRLIP